MSDQTHRSSHSIRMVGSSRNSRLRRPWALIVISTFCAAAVLFPPPAAALTGREVIQRANDREDGDNRVADMEMILVDDKGSRRVRQLKSYEKDFGDDTHTLSFFRSPADVKGTGFLTYDYKKSGKDDDQWLYLPALRKVKRIVSSDQSGSFMGSDFNYSDLTEPDLNDYEYKLMKEVEIEGVMTWQVEMVPRTPDVAEQTGYSKSIVWVRQDNDVVIRSASWVNKSKRVKYMQVKKLENIDGTWVVTELQMKTKEGRTTVHTTLLRFTNVEFREDLGKKLFTLRVLERGL